MSQENQESVFALIEESYPGATMIRRLKHAFEEMTELAIELEPDIDVASLQAVISHAAKKARAQPRTEDGVKKEIGDVRISVIGIAAAAGVDEQEALDAVMADNRARSLAERQAREEEKQQLPIFKP